MGPSVNTTLDLNIQLHHNYLYIIASSSQMLMLFISKSPGILKVTPQSQMLFNKDSQLMDDEKTLAEYGLTSATAKAQCPAPIGLALRYNYTQSFKYHHHYISARKPGPINIGSLADYAIISSIFE